MDIQITVAGIWARNLILMLTYRAYLTGEDGHFHGVRVLTDCRDDNEAIRAAKHFVNGCDVQVWDLDRLVATLYSVGGQVVCTLP